MTYLASESENNLIFVFICHTSQPFVEKSHDSRSVQQDAQEKQRLCEEHLEICHQGSHFIVIAVRPQLKAGVRSCNPFLPHLLKSASLQSRSFMPKCE